MATNRANSPVLVAEAQASELNKKLPIFITATDVNKHPDLNNLLEDLTHRLMPTGMQKGTYNELGVESHAVKISRHRYFRYATFHRAVQDVLYKRPKSADSTKEKILNEARECMILAELQNHVELIQLHSDESPDDDSKTDMKQHLFGINPELVLARAEVRASPLSIREIGYEVEQQVMNEWTNILSFMDPVGFNGYDVEEIIKKPDIIEERQRILKIERGKLGQSITLTDYLFLQVRDHLLQYGNILREMMSKQRLCQYPAKHTESLYVQLSALLLKLKCIELEILLNTYTTKSVPALRYIYDHVKYRLAHTEKCLARLKQELSSFDGLDYKFKALLTEYAKIQSDIEVCKATSKCS